MVPWTMYHSVKLRLNKKSGIVTAPLKKVCGTPKVSSIDCCQKCAPPL